MTGGEGWVLLVFAALFAAALAGGAWLHRKKLERLRSFAAGIGWTYQADAQHLVGRWRGKPFHVGHSRRASHLLAGELDGKQAAAFEYRYTTGHGKNRSTTTYMVCMVALPTALPDLEITNEGLGAKIAKAFGGMDIQFESEEFNRRWRVEARVRKTAHDIVHPRFMELMVAGPPDPIRFEGTDVWTWHLGPIRTEVIHERLTRLSRVVDLVPRHVWQDYGYDPHAGAGRVLDPRSERWNR